MFQYTREFVINEDVKFNSDAESKIVKIEGIASYKLGDDNGMPRILDMVEQPHKDEVLPTATISYPTVSNIDLKLVIRVNLYRATEASYANAQQAKMSKLFQIEIPAGATIADAVKLIEKTLKNSDHPFIVVTGEGTTLTIKGTNCYQQIKEVALYFSRGLDAKHEAQWELKDKSTLGAGALGSQGSGNYAQLIKNNRLPVAENTNYFSNNKYEMPVPGTKYDLVEFKYNSGIRNIGGSGVMGSYERSITTHRFWINKNLTAASEIRKAIELIKANGATEPEPSVPSEAPASSEAPKPSEAPASSEAPKPSEAPASNQNKSTK